MLNNEAGRYKRASSDAQAAARLFIRHRNLPGELRARLEDVYALRSMLSGRDCLRRAEQLGRKLSRRPYHWLRAQLLLESAQCNNFQGKLTEADADAKESRAMATKFPVLTLRIVGVSAGMKHQRGKCDESWTEAQEGLNLYSRGEYPGDRLDQFYAVMWQCARDSGFLYTAEALLRRTIVLREDPRSIISRNEFREGMLHLHLANILAARGEERTADKEKALGLSKLGKTPPEEMPEFRITTEIEPAELLLKQGDAKRALSLLETLQDRIDHMQDHFISLSFYRVLGNAYWSSKRLNEAARAYQHATDIAESTLSTLNSGLKRLEWLRATQECYRGWVRVLLEQNQQEEALRTWEWYQSRPSLQGLYSGDLRVSKSFSAAEGKGIFIPDLPPSPGTRVVYALFKDGLQIWTYKDKQIHGAWAPGEHADLEHDLQDFAELCSTPYSPLDEVQRQGHALYRRLVGPVTPQLPPSGAVTVELDRSAYSVPMEALRSPDGWYFAEKYSVVYSPGIWIDQKLRIPRPLKGQEPLLLMDAARDLPGKDAERKSITEHFPATQIISSKADLVRLLPRNQIFHFMGHGKSDGDGANLILTNGDLLKASDFRALGLSRVRIAVLEACSTEVGKKHGLLDPNSLVQSFLAGHVSSVIASRWEVDSVATSQLMSGFYSSLVSEGSAPSALLNARKAVLAKRPHPYYWAGFSLTGRAE